ncbi:orotate phosphoribosyltransferase [Patescibacteria group bacterium]
MNARVAKALMLKNMYIAGRFRSPRIDYFPFYSDLRIAFSHNQVLKICASEIAKAIKKYNFDIIASREAAGVPFGVAVALRLNKDFLYLRKEAKGYNVNRVIEGDFKKGQRIFIVDDAMSTGGDKKSIVNTLEKAGLKVIGIALVLDAYYGPRYRRSQKWLRRNKKYKYIKMLTWPELMNYAAKSGFMSDELAKLLKKMIYDPRAWQKKESNWQQFKKLAAKEKNIIYDESFWGI